MKVDARAQQVLETLAPRFPDLTDPVVAGVVRAAVVSQLADPQPTFEVIVDHPAAANWRLKQHPDHPDRLRVADCRIYGTAPDPQVAAINEALAAL